MFINRSEEWSFSRNLEVILWTKVQNDAVCPHTWPDDLLLHVRWQHGGRGWKGRDKEEVPEHVREEEERSVQHPDHGARYNGQSEQSQDGQDYCAQNNYIFSQTTQWNVPTISGKITHVSFVPVFLSNIRAENTLGSLVCLFCTTQEFRSYVFD